MDPVALQLIGTNYFSISSAVKVELAANRVFILGSDYYGQQISVYQADNHNLQAQIPVPTIAARPLRDGERTAWPMLGKTESCWFSLRDRQPHDKPLLYR